MKKPKYHVSYEYRVVLPLPTSKTCTHCVQKITKASQCNVIMGSGTDDFLGRDPVRLTDQRNVIRARLYVHKIRTPIVECDNSEATSNN